MQNATILGHAPMRLAITIPGSATAAASCQTLEQLIRAAGWRGPLTMVTVLPQKADGSSREAFLIANPRPDAAVLVDADFTTHGEAIAAGEASRAWSEADAAGSVRSLSTSAISAVVRIDH